MCVCVYIYTYINMRVYINICIHIYTYICIYITLVEATHNKGTKYCSARERRLFFLLIKFALQSRQFNWRSGSYPKNPETPIQKNLCTAMFIAAQFTIAKYWKQPKCTSAYEWFQKLWYIYTMEFYAAERKKELIPFATAWMELESIMLSEISEAVRDKYHMISPLTGT